MNSNVVKQNVTSTETILIQIWRNMFGIEDINTETDFFEIGGNSLNAIKFLAVIEEKFGEEALSIDTLFDNGQLKQLALVIDASINNK